MEWVELEEWLRIALKNEALNVVAINASYPPETIAHLIIMTQHMGDTIKSRTY